MKEDQLYCIAAEVRGTGIRRDITGAMSKESAENWKADSFMKKRYRYFKIAKHPFKPSEASGCGRKIK